MQLPPSLSHLVTRVRSVKCEPGERALVGIAGAPGAGKSTLAAALVAALENTRPGSAAHVPMDGFHLADVQLERLGLRQVKGAPETFDADGYAVLLHRLRHDRDRPVFAPDFERGLEQPIAGAIHVGPRVDYVITEGNYLLLKSDPWPRAREACHEVWFLHVPADLRRRRLIDRHARFGKTLAEATEWVSRNDDANGALVLAVAADADLVVRLL